MCSLEPFKIDLKALEEGKTTLQLQLDDAYFEAIEAPEIHRGQLVADVMIHRAGSVFDLEFHIVGHVHIPCDKCLDDMLQPIEADQRLVARFGEEYSEEDELVVVPEDEGRLDVSWLIYEFIELNIPIKHVHAPGNCNPAMMKMLEEHLATRSSEEEETVDPRWEALRKLKE